MTDSLLTSLICSFAFAEDSRATTPGRGIAMPDASSRKRARRVGTWVALLSEELLSPEDRLSLLALGALSEVSDEGVLLPGDGEHDGTSTQRDNKGAATWVCRVSLPSCLMHEACVVSLLTLCGHEKATASKPILAKAEK